MTAYKLLVKAIDRKFQTVEEYTKKANTFYAFNQLDESEYHDIMNRISEMENAV